MRPLSLILALVALAGPALVGSGCASPPEPVAPAPTPPPPPPDRDGDGILDKDDKCPDQKEDGLPPDPKDGCPTTDKDGDGIADSVDKCPDEKETVNGYQDEDGCPDTVPRVMVTKTEVKINEKILFATGKAQIDPKSDDLIKNIADVVNDNPQIEFIEIAGHADKRGNPKQNAALTKQRAEAVIKALAKHGVDVHRIHGQGYGSYCPVDPGEGEDAFEKNRRVEFKILRISGVETGVPTGCDSSRKEGVKATSIPKNAPTREQLEKARAKAAAARDAAANKPPPKKRK